MAFTAEQMIERRNSIGASECAAACGLSPWKTPFQLWQEKTTGAIPEKDTAPMEWGRRLEAVVLLKYRENLDPTLGVLEAPCPTIVSKAYPFMSCTPDGLLPDRVVEVKTASFATSGEWGEDGSAEVPMQYLLQTVHQMVVTGRRRADIPVLFSGNSYRCYSVAYDEELAALLIERERDFWAHVQDGTPPEVKSIADAQARWPKDTGVSVVATPEIADAVQRLAEVKAEQEKLEADADALSLAIRTCMAEATTLTDSSGQSLATWKAQVRTQFAFQRFKSDHPGLYADYTDKIPTRVFRLSKGKQT
jgi:putative phage-type endonuclease